MSTALEQPSTTTTKTIIDIGDNFDAIPYIYDMVGSYGTSTSYDAENQQLIIEGWEDVDENSADVLSFLETLKSYAGDYPFTCMQSWFQAAAESGYEMECAVSFWQHFNEGTKMSRRKADDRIHARALHYVKGYADAFIASDN